MTSTHNTIEAGPHVVAIFSESIEYNGTQTKRVPLQAHSYRGGRYYLVCADGSELVVEAAEIEDVFPAPPMV